MKVGVLTILLVRRYVLIVQLAFCVYISIQELLPDNAGEGGIATPSQLQHLRKSNLIFSFVFLKPANLPKTGS